MARLSESSSPQLVQKRRVLGFEAPQRKHGSVTTGCWLLYTSGWEGALCIGTETCPPVETGVGRETPLTCASSCGIAEDIPGRQRGGIERFEVVSAPVKALISSSVV